MWDACVDEFLINRELCCHDGIVGRCKYGIHTCSNQCIRSLCNLRIIRAGLFYIFNALLIQIRLCILDRLLGGILRLTVKKSHLLDIRIGYKHQIQNRICI